MAKAVAQIDTEDVSLNTARHSLTKVAKFLQETLTQKLVAYLIGISDGRDVGRYVRGEREPHFKTKIKLRDLFVLVTLMNQSEDAETIQAWLMGRNPELGDLSAASLLNKDFDKNYARVKSAADKFLEMGT